MEGTRRKNSELRDSRSIRTDGSVQRAEAFLQMRDRIEVRKEVSGIPLPFKRNQEAARTSAEAIMARVRDLGVPDTRVTRARVSVLTGIFHNRGFRIASLAAAAVCIAALSSILTFSFIRVNATVDVRFVLVAPDASSVHLAADFNQWSPDGYDLVKQTDGTWEITVSLHKGRAYAYNFIIDGERWIADPSSPSLLDDGFGGSSSSISL